MSDICTNLWNKLSEYKKVLDCLNDENLELTFRDCKSSGDFENIINDIKFNLMRQLSNFNNAKLIDLKSKKVIWQEALILKNLDPIDFHVNNNHISYLGVEAITQDQINKLSKLKNLEELYLRSSDFMGISLLELKNLEKLKMINVYDCKLNQQRIDEISMINNLEKVYFNKGDLSKIDLSGLEKLQKLKKFYVGKCKLTQQQIDGISMISNLEELILSRSNLLEINFMRLKNLKKLKTLNIEYCTLTQQQIDGILKLKNFEELVLSNNDL